MRVTVAAEVARNYFELRGLQQQLAVAERSLGNQRRDAAADRGAAASRLSARSRTWPAPRRGSRRSRQACLRFALAIAEREHALAVLTGVRPGQLAADLSPRRVSATGQDDCRSAIRRCCCARRPDVRAAERRLAAATAREGIAAADLCPRVTVSGFLGLVAGRGSLFGSADSRAWAVTPGA